MNLGQAYQAWQQQSQNRELYLKTREAFRKAWFTLPTNKPCSYYTKEVLGTALAETRVIQSFKARAASVMIHVLTFANFAEPKYNPLPDFTFEDLMEYTKGPLADPNKIAVKREQDDDINDLDIDPITALPRSSGIEEPTEDAVPVPSASALDDATTTDETKTENDMEQKRPRGKQPRKVCQIDAKTLEVIHTYDSCSSGCKTAGVKNLDRAIKLLQKAGGYYWQYPEDVPTFAERLKKKQEDMIAQKTAIASVDATPYFDERVTPKFKVGDHVWAKQPEELHGRTGYVKAVDTARKMYEVSYGADLFLVAEKDLELVNEDTYNGTAETLEYFTKIKKSLSLSDFTDQELLDELDLRGYQGELQVIRKVTLGSKNN